MAGRVAATFACVGSVTAALAAGAEQRLSPDERARADAAARTAFAFLYALPSDTAGAEMGSWVVDSTATTTFSESGRLRLVITRLTDTGDELKLNEMVGVPGTSPAELAAAMVAMQRLEAKVSKAEAEASVEIVVAIDEADTSVSGVSDGAGRSQPAIAGSSLSLRVQGDWMRLDDRELDIKYERWSPATLLVGFGAVAPIEVQRVEPNESIATITVRAPEALHQPGLQSVVVTAQGNQELLDRLVKEARWEALARLVSR
jgi:hypothetical protein